MVSATLRTVTTGKLSLRKGLVHLHVLYIVDLNICLLLIGHLYSLWRSTPCDTSSVFEYLTFGMNHEPLTACRPVFLEDNPG